MLKLLDDKREIEGVYLLDADETCYKVGIDGITKITAYEDGGQFLAIFYDDEILHRIPAAHATVSYYL